MQSKPHFKAIVDSQQDYDHLLRVRVREKWLEVKGKRGEITRVWKRVKVAGRVFWPVRPFTDKPLSAERPKAPQRLSPIIEPKSDFG